MMVSLDGYFEGLGHAIDWHSADTEFNQFAAEQIEQVDTLIFGRRTYELLSRYWPNAKAQDEYDAIVTEKMNQLRKVVFSRSINGSSWHNTTVSADIAEVEKLKREPGKEIAVFGSNALAVALLNARLLDEWRVMVNPVVLGTGTSLFSGRKEPLKLSLSEIRSFKSGNVLFSYRPNSHQVA